MFHKLIFTASIRLRSSGKAPASWHFVTVPKDVSATIRKAQQVVPKKRGRGAVKVEVQIGFVKWKTSVFPSKEHDAYVLPIKKEVRKALHISEGDQV